MSEKLIFGVQKCIDALTPSFGETRTVEATSALSAAERVLARPLAAAGEAKDLAGRVIRLDENYRTDVVMVYDRPSDPT